ncbi:topology modulation protein [Amycolatopsis bartoniae]|uniref:Topology modulation protein n=1 Tax=Amycolatopsis bartoniae TaxID=941986 RepID=A0A8H9MCS6_9PSEU|nr:topology modulation protein [Amycolatopsis bartoniae]
MGCSGAGKSTLARRLGVLLDIPVTHLDRLFWRPGWVAARDDEFRAAQETAVSAPAWVIDGNYRRSMDLRLPTADLVVFLDFPRWRCFTRVVSRIVRELGQDRQAEGCPERLDLEFLRWVWRWHRDHRPLTLEAIRRHGAPARQILLSSPREVEWFLTSLRDQTGSPER